MKTKRKIKRKTKNKLLSGMVALLFVALAGISVGVLHGGASVTVSADTASSSTTKYYLPLPTERGLNTVCLYENANATSIAYVGDNAVFSFAPTILEANIKQSTGNPRYHTDYTLKSVSIAGAKNFTDTTEYTGGITSSKTVTYTLPALPDGIYTLTTKVTYGSATNYEDSFSFCIDRAAPTISGASLSTTGKIINTAFTVTATDSVSGVANLYVKEPKSMTYAAIGSYAKTVQSGSVNGLYSFYAVDNANNQSSVYYVYYDNTAPLGKVTTDSGKTIENGGSTDEAFSYTVTDSGSGLSTLYYKTPSSTAWETYAQGAVIESASEAGEYIFQATDKAGNTETYTVILGACVNGHDYVATVIAPTCTSGGYTLYTCKQCGATYTSDNTIASGHSYTAKTTSATCTNGGYTIYTCTKCGYSFTGNTTAALGHSYTATTTNSTCTNAGGTTYKCTRCGVSYTDSPTQATGHSYVASITEATCTERGYTVFTCTKCGDTYRDNETDPLGHNYVSEVVSSTCTESGYTIYKCTRCNHNYTGGNVQPTGHSYVTTTVAASCSESGYSLHTCSICGESYQDNVTQPLGHNFKSSYPSATCTEYGGTVYTCQVCGYEYRDGDGTYPTGHNYTNTVIISPTCTREGLLRSVCDDCGATCDTEIAANGHSYVILDVVSQNGITTRTYICTECGESYTQELGDQYEEVASYVEYLFTEYSPYMWWVLLAAAGIWSIAIGVMIAIAHKNEDKEKARKMLINYVIGLVVIAVIVVACPYLIRGIAALIT